MDEIEKKVVELVGIPLLVKAIDFLVNLAKKKFGKQSKPSKEIDVNSVDNAKKEAYRLQVNSTLLRRCEYEISSLLEQLEIHQRNLNIALKQKAKWGDSLVPSIIENNIIDEEASIKRKGQKLQILLENLTKQPLPPEIRLEE